jgi:inosine/xanthosine triphosphate pyrophosphatase family protein
MAKSTRPMVRIHNVEINEIVDREMNDTEFEAWKAEQAAQAIAKADAETKETAKAAILDRIGLTVDELKTILG